MAHHVNLETTHQLHQQLISSQRHDPEAYLKICRCAGEALAERGTKFEGDVRMTFALSALCLDRPSKRCLQHVGETLHGIVENALDWLLDAPERCLSHFGEHQRIMPWLRKTPGLDTWQGFSRYDAVITADGGVRILELNTGCPAGFMHAEDFSDVTRKTFQALKIHGGNVGMGLGLTPDQFGTIPGNVLVEELLAIEALAQRPKALVGLINDENGLRNELEMIALAFHRHGRQASIMNAADVQFENGQARWHGEPVSLTYNKIRISTENSSKHHWSAGFEQRYAGYLEAIRQDAVVAVNNLAALTLSEDKGLLEILRLPEFAATLTPEERAFIEEYVLWTVRLSDRHVNWQGQTVDLLPFVRANRERLVIKPANEGRGFGVVIGKYATDEEWAAACELDADVPCVVQEMVEPARLPVLRQQNGAGTLARDHHLTLGLAMIRGRYQGVLSRISTDPVTNVGREGVVQAVFLTD